MLQSYLVFPGCPLSLFLDFLALFFCTLIEKIENKRYRVGNSVRYQRFQSRWWNESNKSMLRRKKKKRRKEWMNGRMKVTAFNYGAVSAVACVLTHWPQVEVSFTIWSFLNSSSSSSYILSQVVLVFALFRSKISTKQKI